MSFPLEVPRTGVTRLPRRRGGGNMNVDPALSVNLQQSQIRPSLAVTPHSIKLRVFLINKHYHGLTDYRTAGAAPPALIPGQPGLYHGPKTGIAARKAVYITKPSAPASRRIRSHARY